MGLTKELTAASVEPLLLSILEKGDSYGYSIIKEVHVLSEGNISWTDGMLYPVLHRLEKRGQIKSYWQVAESGRKRKYYHLKTEGQAALNKALKDWGIANNAINASRS